MSVGEALGDLLWRGGWLYRAILVMGLLGIVASVVSVATLVVWKRAQRAAGVVALVIATAVLGVAAYATWSGRAEADRAAQAKDLPPAKERLLRQGFIEARVASLGGLLLGAFPLIAGAAAVIAGSPRSASASASSPPSRRPALALVPAAAAAALAIAGARAEIPGRELDKAGWDLLDHEAQIKLGRMEEGCSGLERDLRGLGRAEAEPLVGNLAALIDACARHRQAAPSSPGGGER